jgi:hypothetical protein
MTRPALYDGHLPCVVTLSGYRRKVIEPIDLFGAELNLVSHDVFLHADDALGASAARCATRAAGDSAKAGFRNGVQLT